MKSDARAIGDAIGDLNRVFGNYTERQKAAEQVTNLIRTIVKSEHRPVAALKQLLPIDHAINAKTAVARMKTELDVMKSVNHPALVKVLDAHIEQNWFVTEYFNNGTLAQQMSRYRGRVLNALKAFRPIVEAVAELHGKHIVHRDIKPDNVFVADDGQLVLGDCGLAIKLGDQDRLTMTFANVGTRDYMPGWAQGKKLEDVKPTFDVFSLGKLLWAMISGLPKLQLWYFDEEPNDLRTMFPDEPGTLYAHRILKDAVVQREQQCRIDDAGALLPVVDIAIRALSSGGQIPRKAGTMLCRFCGVGFYERFTDAKQAGLIHQGDSMVFWRCNHCGHMESFLYREGGVPTAWTE